MQYNDKVRVVEDLRNGRYCVYMQKKSRIYEYLSIVGIVSVIWLILCYIKGVIPFGNLMIDYGDMREQSEPIYVFMWDVFAWTKESVL